MDIRQREKDAVDNVFIEIDESEKSLLNKLPYEMFGLVLMWLFLQTDICFPILPPILRALRVESQKGLFKFAVDAFIKKVRKGKLDYDFIDQFPKLLKPAHEDKGKNTVDFTSVSGKKSQLLLLFQPFGVPNLMLNITHLILDFSKINQTLIKGMTLGKNYDFEPYFLDLARQLKHLEVTRGRFTQQTMNFQFASILQFLKHAKVLIKFTLFEVPSDDRAAFMNDSDDSFCRLAGGIDRVLALPHTQSYIHGSRTDRRGTVTSYTQTAFNWVAEKGLKADIKKIDLLKDVLAKSSGREQRYHGKFEESRLEHVLTCPPSHSIWDCLQCNVNTCYGCRADRSLER